MKEADGKSISEYLLILVLVGLVAIPSLMFLGNTLQNETQNTNTKHANGVNQLLTLLDARPIETSGGLEGNGYGSSQLVSSLAFNYNATTGFVEMINTADGTETTSGEGTTILVQGLMDIQEKYPDSLTDAQNDLLSQLIQQGLIIADDEQQLYGDSSTGYASGTLADICFFSCPSVTTMYQDFKDYTSTYNSLLSSIESTEGLPPEMQDVIETNSTLINQLVITNFIEPQVELNLLYGQRDRRAELNQFKIDSKNIDITQITIDETPEVTRKASRRMKKKRKAATNGSP